MKWKNLYLSGQICLATVTAMAGLWPTLATAQQTRPPRLSVSTDGKKGVTVLPEGGPVESRGPRAPQHHTDGPCPIDLTFPRDHELINPKNDLAIIGTVGCPYTVEWGFGEFPFVWSSAGVSYPGNGQIARIEHNSFPLTAGGYLNLKIIPNGGAEMLRVVQSEPLLKAGWPQAASQDYGNYLALNQAHFVTGDVRGDSRKEIVTYTTNDHRLKIFSPDGTTLASVSAAAGCTFTKPPTLADLNGDGYNEIITVGSPCGASTRVQVFDANLQLVWERQLTELSIYVGGAVVADLKNDGLPEIILSGAGPTANGVEARIVVLNGQGSTLPGFPRPLAPVTLNGFTYWLDSGQNEPLAAVGNFDGDTDLEITALGFNLTDPSNEGNNTTSLYLNCINVDGTNVAGWPVLVNQISGSFSHDLVVASPAVGHLNGLTMSSQRNAHHEIVIGTGKGVYAFSANGTVLRGWPQRWNATDQVVSLALAEFDGLETASIIASVYPGNDHNTLQTSVHKPDGSKRAMRAFNNWYFTGSVAWSIDATSYPEIITTAQAFGPTGFGMFNLYLWNFIEHAGVAPILDRHIYQNSALGVPAVFDLDDDDTMEIIAGYVWSNSGNPLIAVFESPWTTERKGWMGWPMEHNNPARTGLFPDSE